MIQNHVLLSIGILININAEAIAVYLDPKFKTNYIKIFGVVLVVFGVFGIMNKIDMLSDPTITVVLNGVERNDLEAKLSVMLFPIICVIVGLILTQIRTGAIEKTHTVQKKFWSIFK